MDEPNDPVLSVVYGHNDHLIATVARLWINHEDLVMDVTWGRGIWWNEYQPEHFIRHDLHTLDGVDFRQLPEPDGSVDVIAFDPDYVSTGNVATSTLKDHDFYDRYGLKGNSSGWAAMFAINAAGMKECVRVLRKPVRGRKGVPRIPGGRLLVKSADYVESGKMVWGHKFVLDQAEDLGLEAIGQFIHVTGTGPQPKNNLDGSPRRQVHQRRAHSFLTVFQKSVVTPPRPAKR